MNSHSKDNTHDMCNIKAIVTNTLSTILSELPLLILGEVIESRSQNLRDVINREHGKTSVISLFSACLGWYIPLSHQSINHLTRIRGKGLQCSYTVKKRYYKQLHWIVLYLTNLPAYSTFSKTWHNVEARSLWWQGGRSMIWVVRAEMSIKR